MKFFTLRSLIFVRKFRIFALFSGPLLVWDTDSRFENITKASQEVGAARFRDSGFDALCGYLLLFKSQRHEIVESDIPSQVRGCFEGPFGCGCVALALGRIVRELGECPQ
jgi:hypothetical protein